MQFKGEIATSNILKKGMKITVFVPDDEMETVLREIHGLIKKPVSVSINIDEKTLEKREAIISPEQRKKIYAILGDMESFMGDTKDNIEHDTKQGFAKLHGIRDFSLAVCSREEAYNYIEYLIRLCFEFGVPLKEIPRDAFGDDLDRYLQLCLNLKICCISGEPGEVHHWDTVGANGGRKYDDGLLRKICLNREYHTEAHKIGRDEFEKKYHVHGIIYNK